MKELPKEPVGGGPMPCSGLGGTDRSDPDGLAWIERTLANLARDPRRTARPRVSAPVPRWLVDRFGQEAFDRAAAEFPDVDFIVAEPQDGPLSTVRRHPQVTFSLDLPREPCGRPARIVELLRGPAHSSDPFDTALHAGVIRQMGGAG